MPEVTTSEEQAEKQINELFATIKKHGKYMVGGIDFQNEIRETLITVTHTITSPLEERVTKQEIEIRELRSMIDELRLKV